MKEATQELNLKIKGKAVKIPKEDHYFTEEDTPVIKHAPLKKLAEKFSVRVEDVKLEATLMTTEGVPYVSHRAYGKDENGNVVTAVGEAGPYSLDGLASNYPFIMSNKRAEDRLLIALLGLEGVVYSEAEISETSGQNASAAQSNQDPAQIPFPFGKHKGKTLEQIKDADIQYLQWFTSSYTPRNPKDKQLVEAAKQVLAA
ncbi:hypothetical protein ACFYKX_11795 [Cytobacillus sp. FJAT-54145]|uniref:Exodeoxyribonuclease X-like C-terminal domain-containing protein n=1 Tax=Cytobacillus spartinae TaxID=3299023 RepID=A0ABW6KCG8_9BACI